MIPTSELQSTELQYPVSLMVSSTGEEHLELYRLLAAAVVNPHFCRLLLVDPKQALEDGYQGETFFLGDADRFVLLSLHADTLAELARQITQALGPREQSRTFSFAPVPDFIGF